MCVGECGGFNVINSMCMCVVHIGCIIVCRLLLVLQRAKVYSVLGEAHPRRLSDKYVIVSYKKKEQNQSNKLPGNQFPTLC